MAPRVPDTPIPFTRNHGFQEAAGIAMTAEGHDVIAVTFPKQNMQKEEKQIALDPMSLKDHSHLSPLETTALPMPPPLHPPKAKFLSISQPNSATSSPRFALKKKPKGDQILALDSSPCELLQDEEICLQKSKSCGEGRACAPSQGFEDFLFIKPKSEGTKDSSPKSTRNKHMEGTHNSKGFTCCFHLRGFGKAKPVRANKKEESNSKNINIDGVISRTVSLEKFECGSWAPSPRAIIQAELEGNDCISSYFDLPSELIKCGAGGGEDDAHSPVTAAFVFDKEIKGVLKNGTSRSGGGGGGRKSDASPRHVRFSTSSSSASPASTCITPRLRRAREEFNAFLEAQSA